MKVVYVSWHSHCSISLEPILEALSERGHEIIKYDPDRQKQNKIISKDTDIVLITSNAARRRPTNLDKHIRTYFVPHGLGLEQWENIMNYDTKVFLAGKRPWTPSPRANNWKIVGWAKTDALFNPRKDRVDYVNNLMANLPYDKSVLCIPSGTGGLGLKMSLLIDYFNERRINVVAPYRERRNRAMKYFKKYKHIAFPEIQNLYYLAPHVRVVICIGGSSVGREFYITKIPTIRLYHGFKETLNLSNPNRENFHRLFSVVWDNPNLFIQPDRITKFFIEINDGKVVERIIKEMEIR